MVNANFFLGVVKATSADNTVEKLVVKKDVEEMNDAAVVQTATLGYLDDILEEDTVHAFTAGSGC